LPANSTKYFSHYTKYETEEEQSLSFFYMQKEILKNINAACGVFKKIIAPLPPGFSKLRTAAQGWLKRNKK
jgi:hypothetical protein